MASTYTTNLGIEKIATGEQSGTWGETTNTNWDMMDAAINGIVSVTLASAGTSGSPNSLALSDGAVADGLNAFIEYVDGGDLGATAYVQLTPNDAEKVGFFRNSLSGGRDLVIFQGTYNASRAFTVPNGADVLLKFSGGGTTATTTDVLVNLTPTGITTGASGLTLGGNMDVGSSAIVSTSNGNIAITPDGTGKVVLDGLSWPTADGTADYVLKTDGAGNLSWTAASSGGISNVVEDTTPQLGGNLDVNGSSIVSVSNGNIVITPDGTGTIILDGLSWPTSDGTADYVLKTDGAGNLSWTAASAGGLSNVVEDTTPQLGGNLDVNGNSIVSVSAGDIAITPDTTGKVVLDGLSWPTADGSASQILSTDGAGNLSWTDASGGATTLGSLTDVTITTVGDNDILAYDTTSGDWINQTAAESGLATAAQGALADSATQPGDNISTLTNNSGFIDSTGVTYEALAANSDVGSGATQVAQGNHGHTGVYEPADGTILKEADVDDTPVNGVTQYPISSNWAFDHAADTSAHGGPYNNYSHPNHSGEVTSTGDGAQVLTVSAITNRTALTSGLADTDEFLISDAGVLKKMDASVAKTYVNTNVVFVGSIEEDVYNSSSTSLALNPANGTIQYLTPASPPTYTDSLTDGESITVIYTSASAATWPAGTLWIGGSAPTLDASNPNHIEFWKRSTVLYAAYVGASS